MTETVSTHKMNEVSAGVLLFLFCALVTEAHAQTEIPDTVGHINNLEEIIVTARDKIISADRVMYYPDKELKSTTNNGIQLLSGLQIPEIIVNPAGGNVSLAGSNKLSIKINGRQATESDLLSISSKDITRVDFISNPGARYGDADAVLDITVRRRETGYGLLMNVIQSANRGWGNYTGSLKYNVGRSEWSLDYNSNPMWDMDCYRNNNEHIRMPDGSMIDRCESGIETPNRMVTHRISLQYSYAVGNRLLANFQTRVTRKNDKYVSKGLITTYTEDEISTGYESETLPIKDLQCDFDIYMHYKINRKNKIFLNIIPTVSDGSNKRMYETEEMRIASDIINRGYHLLAEGIWEGEVGKGKLTAGLRSRNGWIKSSYRSMSQVIREDDSENHLFVEWRQKLDKLEYSIGADGILYAVKKPVNYTCAYINPRLTLKYRPFTCGGVNVSLKTSTVSPTVNQINPVEQRVDRFLWTTGNPELKPFQKYEQNIEFDFNHNGIFAKVSVVNRYCHKPIMEAKSYVGNKIVGSYFNSGFNNDFEIRGILRLPLFVKQLSLSIDGGWHKTISSGINYRHSYSQPFINAQVMFMTDGWWVMARYNNTYNQLWGEMISSVNQNLINFGVGYTYRSATFSLGIVNPFGNVSICTKELGDRLSYDRKYQASGSHRLIWLGVTVNLNKGKKRSASKKRLDNSTIYESIINSKK